MKPTASLAVLGLMASVVNAAPDPTQAQAPVPAATHRSALALYRVPQEPLPTTWPQANRTVNRIGGWRSYARERMPEPPVPLAPAASAPAGAHRHP